ncbi:glycoside hydrolase family 3 N-terminal domain-containing protein [Kitasatospora phosalacinea]|uniref:glycoside hydrolase family 3 N-terminal domain-containing protein n=1 Tax=Kitasatospora phosalacinea TaxID=2065 RepID=UPI003655E72D
MSQLDDLLLPLLLPAVTGDGLTPWLREGLAAGLPGVLVLPGAVPGGRADVAALTAELHGTAEGLLVAADEEGGDVTLLDHRDGSAYPGSLALGAADDLELTARTAAAMAEDLAAVGITYNLAPSLDVNSDPRNPIIGVRAFGDDPQRVAAHGAAFVTAVQARGVAVAAKHFPGHGATVEDSHHTLPVVQVDEATFRARELAPFAAAVAAGVRSLMTAHVLFPQIDPDAPASLSSRVLRGLLREELGFGGVVLGTAVAMASAAGPAAMAGAAVRSLAAGTDLLLLGAADPRALYPVLADAVGAALRDGTLDEETLARAGARVAELRAWSLAARRSPGRLAAARAVRAEGEVALPAPAVVVELREDGPGSGPEWSLAEPLAALGLLADRIPVGPDGPAPGQVLGPVGGTPLVLAVRDAYRHPWQREWVDRALALRSDAVLVAVGMPDDLGLTRGAAVAAYGAGRVNTEAAAALLAGR